MLLRGRSSLKQKTSDLEAENTRLRNRYEKLKESKSKLQHELNMLKLQQRRASRTGSSGSIDSGSGHSGGGAATSRPDDGMASVAPSPATGSRVDGSSWTLHGWLSSIDTLALPVAIALETVASDGENATTPLQLVETSLTREALAIALRAASLEGLCDEVWAAVLRLREGSAPSAEQLQGKFVQDGAGVLSYSSLNTFFSGLEGVLGAPSPQFMEAMAKEHTACGDSNVRFSSENYGVETCSAVEWRFVAEPEAPPEEGGWPTEGKLELPQLGMWSSDKEKSLYEAGAQPRGWMKPQVRRARGEPRSHRGAAPSERRDACSARPYMLPPRRAGCALHPLPPPDPLDAPAVLAARPGR